MLLSYVYIKAVQKHLYVSQALSSLGQYLTNTFNISYAGFDKEVVNGHLVKCDRRIQNGCLNTTEPEEQEFRAY